MGLEIVGIVLSVEERFGISMPDRDVIEMETVGDMHRYILDRLSESGRLLPGADREGSACPSLRAFNRVRRGLVNTVSVDRRSVRLDARLSSLLPWHRRRSHWAQLERDLGHRLPRLAVPRWVALAPIFVSEGVFLSISRHPLMAFLALVCGLLLSMPLLEAVEPLGWAIPRQCATIRDLTAYAVIAQPGDTAESGTRLSPESVWRGLQTIIVEELDISPSMVSPEARFVRDLGAG